MHRGSPYPRPQHLGDLSAVSAPPARGGATLPGAGGASLRDVRALTRTLRVGPPKLALPIRRSPQGMPAAICPFAPGRAHARRLIAGKRGAPGDNVQAPGVTRQRHNCAWTVAWHLSVQPWTYTWWNSRRGEVMWYHRHAFCACPSAT